MDALKNTAAVRQHNLEVLLRLVEAAGPISRAGLARASGLSQPTVSAAVEGLLRTGLVEVLGEGDSTGGRRPVLLRYNAGAGRVVAVDLGGTNLKLGLADLSGRLLERAEEPTPTGDGDGQQVLEKLATAVERFVARTGTAWRTVLALGVGVPGVTDPRTGLVNLAPAVGWEEKVPVRAVLAERFALPCRVDNDVNAAALAELAFGRGRELSDFVFVAIGTGIGAGVVLGGRLHRGRNCAAGEAGYLVIDRKWRPDSVTGFGCFESLVAAPAIARQARRDVPAMSGVPAGSEVEVLFELARGGDAAARRVVEAVASDLGSALTNLAVILDPEAIVLGGGVSRAGEVLLEPVRRRLRELSPIVPEVCVSSLGAEAGLLGAAALAIEAAKERLLSAV